MSVSDADRGRLLLLDLYTFQSSTNYPGGNWYMFRRLPEGGSQLLQRPDGAIKAETEAELIRKVLGDL